MASLLRQAGGRVAGLCNRGARSPVCRVVAAFEQRDRGASSRARGGGGGGRWSGGGGGGRERGGRREEQSSGDVWGGDWDLGGGGASSSKEGGWLSTSDEPRRGGGEREWRDRAPAGGRERRGDRGPRGGGGWGGERSPRGGGDWAERRGGRGDRADRRGSEWGSDSASGGSRDWGSDRGPSRGGRDWGERGDRRQRDRDYGGGDRYGGRDRYGGGERQQRGGRTPGRSAWGDAGADANAERYDGAEAYSSFDADEAAYAQQPGGAGGAGGGLRDQFLGDVLYGVSPVLAALHAGRRTVHALYLQDGMDLSKRKDKGAIQAARRRAEELGARVEYASKHDLNMVADNRPHQGLVLDCSPLEFEPMPELPAPAAAAAAGEGGGGGAAARLPVWLCLDEVMDPQNFGAALRSAHFLGVAGVLTCHRNSAPLSAAVSKASAGAMEVMPVHSCKSLPQTLAAAKEAGWQVLGAAAEPGAVPAAAFTLTRPSILVMGNEGYGLRTTVRRLCDAMLQIEQGGAAGSSQVDSLNVSVATGILLHRLLTAQAPVGGGGSGAAATAAEA